MSPFTIFLPRPQPPLLLLLPPPQEAQKQPYNKCRDSCNWLASFPESLDSHPLRPVLLLLQVWRPRDRRHNITTYNNSNNHSINHSINSIDNTSNSNSHRSRLLVPIPRQLSTAGKEEMPYETIC